MSPRCRAIDLASWSVMARQYPVDARSLAVVRLSRFAPRAGLVTLRQILVRRCHRANVGCRELKDEQWEFFSPEILNRAWPQSQWREGAFPAWLSRVSKAPAWRWHPF